MAHPAHPQAMRPSRPGRTRTAPPQAPPKWPMSGRYRAHTLFGATGFVYLLLGFLALRVVWALGSGPGAWDSVIESFDSPLYVAFHLLALVSVVFVGVRFFSLFPRAQPPHIGPAAPPPPGVLLAMLYAVWIGVTVAFVAVLGGAFSG